MQMRTVYIIVYNHPSYTDLTKLTVNNAITNGFLADYTNWLYDIGDDPSFYCSKKFNFSITWGICRPDVRNNVDLNDVIVFFCFDGAKNNYNFIGLATVKDKIRQTDIWGNPTFSGYQKYFNLLIRPKNSKWEHYEPLFNKKGQHKNWYSRIGENYPKNFFNVRNGSLVTEYGIKENYVIFDTNTFNGFILKQPIHVANWKKGQKKETWVSNAINDKIRDFTFTMTKRDSLRIHERNSAHRHIKISMADEELACWRTDFIKFLNEISS